MSQIHAPQGFRFSVASAGLRKGGRNDLALVVSDAPALAAGVFTTNLFAAAPVTVAKEYLSGGSGAARAVLINTGQANACTGEAGLADCRESTALVAKETGLRDREILPASTGVIGARMNMDYWRDAVPGLCKNLGSAGLEDFAAAIMTTDAFPKFASSELQLRGGKVRLAGVAKGAGMICPNMATMLSTVLCDADLEEGGAVWQAMFVKAVNNSFNRVTVDGDTSTNDTVFGLANGASGVKVGADEQPLLQDALTALLSDLAYMLVKDGEGATKVIKIKVSGAEDNAAAEKVARTVGHSQLVKTAMYGRDANWGRIVAAAGRSGVRFNPDELRLLFCGVELFKNSRPTELDFDTLLKVPLQNRDLLIEIFLGSGSGSYELLASDLTHKYIDINADYRS